jgi:hypothetical protein
MNWDTSAKQRFTVLQSLAASPEWNEADAQQAIKAAVTAFPQTDPVADAEALKAALGQSITGKQIDGSLVQAMSKAAPMFGVDLSATQPVVAGIQAALAENRAARKLADAKAAIAAGPSEQWIAKAVVKDRMFDEATIRAIPMMASDPGMRARFGVPLDVMELRGVLDAVSPTQRNSMAMFSRPVNPNRPIDMPIFSMLISELTVGDLALAIFEVIHVRNNEDADAMSQAILGHPNTSRSMYTTSVSSLTPRVRITDATVEVGYDVDMSKLSQCYNGKETQALGYIHAQVKKLRYAIATGTPAFAVK